jgi:hypothetical protein
MSKRKPYTAVVLDPDNEFHADVLRRIKTFPRIDFEAYKELVKTKQLEPFCNLKYPRQIFFDEETGMFCYYSPYHGILRKCAKWKEELEN